MRSRAQTSRPRRRGIPGRHRSGSTTKNSPDKIQFVIANGDEGDPGAFMDRAIMEGDPHSLLEGMLHCAYTPSAHSTG